MLANELYNYHNKTVLITRNKHNRKAMEKRSMRTSIVVPPEYFSQELMYDYILRVLRSKEMTCNATDGYIDHIDYQITNVTSSPLMDSGYFPLIVEYEGYCFKPAVGKRIQTEVQYIFQHGIFSKFYCLKVLIPYPEIQESYEFSGTVYRHRTNGSEIKIGSMLTVEITNFRFEKGTYNCIARIIEEDNTTPPSSSISDDDQKDRGS